MKLFLKRSQYLDKGFFGSSIGSRGMRFALDMRVELTPHEQELVRKYDLKDAVIATHELETLTDGKRDVSKVAIKHLVAGTDYNCSEMPELLTLISDLKKGCALFKAFLEELPKFDGEEMIEF